MCGVCVCESMSALQGGGSRYRRKALNRSVFSLTGTSSCHGEAQALGTGRRSEPVERAPYDSLFIEFS